jgi:lipopolysaccharide/colanic/teichoic acid biosynthesis glycosyltransferase
MVHEDCLETPFRSPVSRADGRPSGPILLEPSPHVQPLSAAVTTSTEEKPSSPWRAAARAKGRPGYFLAKRCLDVLLVLLALGLLWPLFLATALLVRLSSPGPALFRQERVGYGGRRFVLYKFRSMYTNSDERLHQVAYAQFLRGERASGKVDGAVLAALSADGAASGEAGSAAEAEAGSQPSGDPRITKVGHFLRRSSLDELPQLFNVLRGEMSLVGPRPPIPYEVDCYAPWHRGRLDTLPGLTGEWQVHGRGRVTFERMVEMDLAYIDRQSFWYDLKLLVLTLPTVLARRGAW